MSMKNKLTQLAGRQALKLSQKSPTILFVAGVAGVLGGTYLACKATLKLEKTLDDFKEEVDGVKTDLVHTEEYQKDLAYVYAKNTVKLVKLYAPSAIVMTASVFALTKSHRTLTKRNAALTAAYALVQTAYENYRARVREELGEERELDIYHGVEVKYLPKGENGAPEAIKSVDPNKMSPYAKFFDEGSPYWQKDPELNRLYVQCQQNWANELLRSRGHVFLNDVYDMLGIDRTRAGAVVGWVIGKEGDNYISFGLFEAHNSAFVNSWERTILLDFNVDGVIYDKI